MSCASSGVAICAIGALSAFGRLGAREIDCVAELRSLPSASCGRSRAYGSRSASVMVITDLLIRFRVRFTLPRPFADDVNLNWG